MQPKKIKRKIRSDKFLFSPSEIKRIEKMAALGLSVVQISSLYDISTDTFYRRCKEENFDLSAALHRGKAKAIGKVAQKAYELALAGDVSMIKYYLSCMGGWSQKSQLTTEQETKPVIQYSDFLEIIDNFTDEEMDAICTDIDSNLN